MKGRPAAALPTEAFFSNVPYNTSEEHLREIFSTAGEVANLQLFRKNGESRGMGVVTFLDPESVQRAVQMLRDVDVGDRKLWVSTHNRSPELERGGAAPTVPTTSSKVFFSNVPFDVGEEQLQMLFSEVGIVTELTIFTGKEGQSRGMGHCTFQVPSQAAAAIKVLRDRDVGGRPIWIAEDVKASQIPAQTVGVPMVPMVPAPVLPQVSPVSPVRLATGAASMGYGHSGHVASGGRIFFGNVPFDVHEAQLEQLFRSIGPITDLHLMRTADGKSRGMGHVTYQMPELAALAIQQLLDRDVGGRPILVKEDRSTGHPAAHAAPPLGPARSAATPVTPVTRGPPPNEGMATSSRVFFSNVPYTVSEAELLSLFRQVGSVLELNLFQNELGRSRGMGHCLFQSPQEAQLAIQELRDVDVGGRPIWIAEDTRGKTPGATSASGKGAMTKGKGAMHRAAPY